MLPRMLVALSAISEEVPKDQTPEPVEAKAGETLQVDLDAKQQ